jgi:hypothetical protein
MAMKHITMVALGLASFAATAAFAQPTPMTHQHDDEAAKGPGAPGLGEIMSLQQMRHLKLWFAGNAGNWELAGYQIDELKEGFESAGKLFPKVNDVDVAHVVDGINGKEMTGLEKIVEAKDRAKFAAAFDRLTAACNACHQSTKHGFIVIQRPTAMPYTNQNFAPVGAREGRRR